MSERHSDPLYGLPHPGPSMVGCRYCMTLISAALRIHLAERGLAPVSGGGRDTKEAGE